MFGIITRSTKEQPRRKQSAPGNLAITGRQRFFVYFPSTT
jgi:hypothetical protein